MPRRVAALAVMVALLPALAHADRRGFDFTYEYATQPASGVELEVYNTQGLDGVNAERAADRDSAWQHRAQVEYGVTDRFDLALAQVFEQIDLEGARYAATVVRARYRFAERGEWPVDIAAIVEAGKRFSVPAFELEPRL